VINQKYKVFLFTFLILSLALVPPTNFAFADDVLVVDDTNSPYNVSSDEQWNNVIVMPNKSLIIPADATLTVNQIDFSKINEGLDVFPNAVVTIEVGGTLVVNGNTQNKGEIFIDGSYFHYGYPGSGGFIINAKGTIYERCGLLDEQVPPTYAISGPITDDFANCNDSSNIITKVNLTVEEGETFVIEKNQILNLFGETTLHGILINRGILNNPTIVTLDGGEIRNIEGTINNICGGQGYPFPNYIGSGGDQDVGTVQDVTCLEPEAFDDDYQVNEDDILTVSAPGVLGNDLDVDMTGSLTAQNPSDPTDGTLSDFALDGSFVYTPNENFSGIDSFTYEVKDGDDATDTATVTIDETELSLHEQKINKIEELDDMTDEASKKKTVDEINKAVKDLDKSVEDKKWKDNGNYLVYKEGDKVFDEQQKGVKHIIHLLDDDKESDDFLSKVTSIALDLVDIDNQIATNEFIIAEKSPDSTQECLDDAEKEYKKSDKELKNGKYDKAIDHMGHLWEKSLKCQGINTG